ncbi:MAG: M20/M25/M40 family metallo-hydrolase [Planctomycetota bacterium]|nr:M20/M25/M40 family metallo-hydrolase [Planctomycetota bacterium]
MPRTVKTNQTVVKSSGKTGRSTPKATLSSGGIAAVAAVEPDLNRATKLVLELLAIPGLSGQEGKVARFITQQLVAAGADRAAIVHDKAHTRTPLAGEVGNLIFKLPGTIKGPPRLLMAHMDTVPICEGARPVIDGEQIRSADPKTGLGADDRAGVAAVLTAALEILRNKLPHPPLTFFWPIQEEIGLHGARHAEVKMLGGPKLAFNWDGGTPEKITIGATGGYRMEIDVHGLASHAGVSPEKGISAIAIASLAIADLQRDGWLGLVEKGKNRGTSNIGVISGGDATNVVTEHVRIRAEARSHQPAFRQRIIQQIENAFAKAAREVKSASNLRGSVEIRGTLDYEAFRLADNEPCIVAAEGALHSLGITPLRAVSNGGLDANWMNVHGIPTVTLGCGQVSPHTVSERLNIAAFHVACRVALRLATGSV